MTDNKWITMKRLVIVFIYFVSTLGIFGKTIEYSRTMNHPEIVRGDKYLKINYEETRFYGEERLPDLPRLGISYLLLQNEKI